MKNILLYLFAITFLIACENGQKPISEKVDSPENSSKPNDNFGIVIHGGVGTISKESMSDSLDNAYREKLQEAISERYVILKNGGTSLDAVTHSKNVIEDSPLFKAGKGS